MSENESIAVLIADLVKSREIEDRERVQKDLKNEIEKVSEESKTLISTPSIVRGDEIEIAYENAADCFLQFEKIENILFPRKLRGGIGVGSVDTGIRESVSEMDGSAFHRAREALEESKKTGETPILRIKSKDSGLDEVVNTVFGLLYAIREEWTKRERELSLFYLQNKSKTHEEIADFFDISRPMVSKTLSSAHIKPVVNARDFLYKRLSSTTGED